jgi:hypothetical protein
MLIQYLTKLLGMLVTRSFFISNRCKLLTDVFLQMQKAKTAT